MATPLFIVTSEQHVYQEIEQAVVQMQLPLRCVPVQTDGALQPLLERCAQVRPGARQARGESPGSTLDTSVWTGAPA